MDLASSRAFTSKKLLQARFWQATRKKNATRPSHLRVPKMAVMKPITEAKYEPVLEEVCAFSPATVANLGPGFDFLGCAVEGQGDVVEARLRPDLPGKVIIEDITGEGGRLSRVAEENCCGIGAIETLKLLGVSDMGVSLCLQKGLNLGSGLGSSSASSAAAAWAVNALYGCPLTKAELVPAGLVAEAAVSGWHADNIAPAIMGGFVLIRSYEPKLQLQPLEFGAMVHPGVERPNLWFVLVTPKFEAPTREMRAALPKEVPLKSMVHNSLQGGSLVAGILHGDAEMLGQALNSDCVIEPARGPLIPGFAQAKEAALKAGAFGCTISGAGPTVVAIVKDQTCGVQVADAVIKAFIDHGKLEIMRATVSTLSTDGAFSCEGASCSNSLNTIFVV